MNKTKDLFFKDLKKPFQVIDVKECDYIQIVGNEFPLKSNQIKKQGNFPTKPPISIDEMIERLKEHEILFSVQEKENARIILREINYYRLSVFEKYLKSKPASFTELYELYSFDCFLRNSLDSLIKPVEFYIKTSLTYYITNNYPFSFEAIVPPALAYLDTNLYRTKEVKNQRVKTMFSNFYSTLERNLDREPSLIHHISNYGGNIPMWVLVEHLTFGNISTLITYLSRSVRKSWVDSELKSPTNSIPVGDNKLILGWTKSMVTIRNTCAHGGRLYSRKFPSSSTLNEQDSKLLENLYPHQYREEDFKHTILASLFVIRRFYLIMSEQRKSLWNDFINDLKEQVDSSSQLQTSHLGLENFDISLLLIS